MASFFCLFNPSDFRMNPQNSYKRKKELLFLLKKLKLLSLIFSHLFIPRKRFHRRYWARWFFERIRVKRKSHWSEFWGKLVYHPESVYFHIWWSIIFTYVKRTRRSFIKHAWCIKRLPKFHVGIFERVYWRRKFM